MGQKVDNNLPKIVVILGPTASGKTSLAISLAKQFGGEIVSADSRQIYRNMKIGTDAAIGQWIEKDGRSFYVADGIVHHLIDCVNPDKSYSVADFKDQAIKTITDILRRDRLPMVVGGTGLYISALVDNFTIPKVEPNQVLRRQLESKTSEELKEMLKKIDPESFAVIDIDNSRRVIRALEVAMVTGKSFLKQQKKANPLYKVLLLGISRPRADIYESINRRIDDQIKKGLLSEVKGLLDLGYDWSLPSMSGLGYRQFREYLEGKNSLEQSIEILKRDTRRYAKRQFTWFKKNKNIKWIEGGQYQRAAKLVGDFLLL